MNNYRNKQEARMAIEKIIALFGGEWITDSLIWKQGSNHIQYAPDFYGSGYIVALLWNGIVWISPVNGTPEELVKKALGENKGPAAPRGS